MAARNIGGRTPQAAWNLGGRAPQAAWNLGGRAPQAAWNLGGRALRAAIVSGAAAEGAARLYPRFKHTGPPADGAPPAIGSSNLTAAERASLYRSLRDIHNRREELYDLSAAVQRNYSIPSCAGRANKELLRSLAAQVDPRPNDPLWLMFRMSRRANNFLKYIAAAASVYVITTQFTSGKDQ